MNIRTLLMAFLVWLSAAAAAQASTLDFNFTFTNSANGGGTVFGIIRGLHDNATGAAASVEIISNTAGFGVGEYVPTSFANSFSVLSGSMVVAVFDSYGQFNTPPAVTCCSLFIYTTPNGSLAGLSNVNTSVPLASDTGLIFTPATVPLPAGLPLLATGLAGFTALRMRKKRKAQV